MGSNTLEQINTNTFGLEICKYKYDALNNIKYKYGLSKTNTIVLKIKKKSDKGMFLPFLYLLFF